MLSIDIEATFHASRGVDQKGLRRIRAEILETHSLALPDLISESWKELAVLQRQLIHVSRRLYLAKAALEPVHSLPDDLLVYIFDLVCRPDDQDGSPLDGWRWFKSRPSPIVALSHACSRWRRAALQAKMLWSDIRVDQRDDVSSSGLLAYLERSETVPLRLTATIPDSHYDDPRDPPYLSSLTHYIEGALAGHASRVEELHIRVFDRLRPIFPRMQTPALRALHLVLEQNKHVLGYQVEEYWRARGVEQVPLLLDAPRLRALVLQGTGAGSFFPYMENLGRAGVLWSTLTVLRMHEVYCTTRSAAAVLRACRALRECRLAVDDTVDAVHGGFPTAPEWESSTTVVELPELRALAVVWRTVVQENLLGRLRSPYIEELSLALEPEELRDGGDLSRFDASLLQFAEGSDVRDLRALRLEGFGLSGVHPTAPSNRTAVSCSVLLRSLPRLKELHLACRYDDGLIDSLKETTQDGRPSLCPELCKVHLEFPCEPSAHHLVDRHLSMASTRWASPTVEVDLCILPRDPIGGNFSWRDNLARKDVAAQLSSLRTTPKLRFSLPDSEERSPTGGFLSYAFSNFLFV
ncbi:hypothetical protein BD626DRAFT_26278 [Schizophyllum amplum]|uniref:Uncharacterized protein n=1 Tax=Schizophyllum amplum TaxID=97359 RepID=A0A550CZP5_9AGAR|nr:hypothetical protein BD626DRAFT_26278 [Auriculariopsis ampla]